MMMVPENQDDFNEHHQHEYGVASRYFRWLEGDAAAKALVQRQRIIDSLTSVHWDYHNTKVYRHALSPGCRLCGSGSWSCLFINGLCRAGCFFCPTTQETEGVPGTNNLDFEQPRDYLDYVARFQFQGVSFSGGEPFLTPDRTLKFLAEVRKRFGTSLYIWIYTSGAGLTSGILRELQAVGLDEMRFNLCATDYKLGKIKEAVTFIKHVTIEIPAVPEDYSRLNVLLKDASEAGVSFLNLHQLRCTPHNYRHFLERDYTFIYGRHPAVFESEMTALRLLQLAEQENAKLPINYCSYVYKQRYQAMAARKRAAAYVCEPFEEITENGYIRRLTLTDTPKAIQKIITTWGRAHQKKSLWSLNSIGDQLSFHRSLWPDIIASEYSTTSVSYFTAVLRETCANRNHTKTIHLNSERVICSEKIPVLKELPLKGTTLVWFRDRFMKSAQKKSSSPHDPINDLAAIVPDEEHACNRILELEKIPEGLQTFL